MKLQDLELLLRQGEIARAVAVAQRWARSAQAGDLEQQLQVCSTSFQPKVASLIRDCLTRYPNTIVGCPVMFYIEPESEHQRSLSVELPDPSESLDQPSPDLRFLRWLSIEGPMPILTSEQQPRQEPTRVPFLRMVARVALFELLNPEQDLQAISVSDHWWGKMLWPIDAQVHIHPTGYFPYLDAIETARCAQASANGIGVPPMGYFQSDSAWSEAWNKGVQFRESCRTIFPHANLP